MVQFNLPDNSKLTDGDYYKLESENKRIKKFKIYRWSPEDDKNPEWILMKLISMIVVLWY